MRRNRTLPVDYWSSSESIHGATHNKPHRNAIYAIRWSEYYNNENEALEFNFPIVLTDEKVRLLLEWHNSKKKGKRQ